MLIVLLTTTIVHGTNDDPTSILPGNCTIEEYAGIGNCVSAGSGFTFDQKKAERCPQSGSDPSTWNDEMWQCYIYCSNPDRSDERKACTSCEEVNISTRCVVAQSAACKQFKSSTDNATVDCDSASALSIFLGGLLAIGSIYLLL
jgi:hypothetical protein